jgi:hypothetical protein
MGPFFFSHEPHISGKRMKQCSTPGEELLAEYIVLATFGLVPAARERIQMEVEAHYAEGVSRRLGEGMPQEQAEIAAVHELGRAADAAKQYRKRYLTLDDVSWLRRFEDARNPQRPLRTMRRFAWGMGAFAVLAPVLFTWLVVSKAGLEPWGRILLFSLTTGLGLAVSIGAAARSWRWCAKLPSGPALWRKLLGLSLIQFQIGCLFCAAQLLGGAWVLGIIPDKLEGGILLLGLLPVLFTKRFRLWRKLRFKQIETGAALA